MWEKRIELAEDPDPWGNFVVMNLFGIIPF
jgi:hypothetical protein